MKSLSRLTKWISFYIKKDSRQCLQFFNDIGMLLWYKDDKQLQDIVFHNVSELKLKFGPDTSGQRETDFNADVATFTETGLLTDDFLQIIWEPLELNAATQRILKHFLINLELCYIDHQAENDEVSSENDIISPSLRFP